MALAIAGMMKADRVSDEEAARLVEPLMTRILEVCGVELEAFNSAYISLTR